MKDKIVLVKCFSIEDLDYYINKLWHEMKLNNIDGRVNLRKKEITIYGMKIKFVSEHQNIIGIRFDYYVSSIELEINMSKIIKTILDSKNCFKS